VDLDGKYSFDGNCALAEDVIEEVPKAIPPAASSGSLALFSKLGPWAILFLVCQLFTSDSVKPPLPPGYYKDSYGNIFAPNGACIATIEQAFKHAEGDPEWSIVESWGKGTFDTANDSLLHHFKKHGEEVGATSPEQYLNKAKGFAQNLKRIHPTHVDGETPGVLRYRKNGKYIDIAPNGDIISFGKVGNED